MDTDVVTERPSPLAETVEKTLGVLAVLIVLLHVIPWGLPGRLSMVTPADVVVAAAFVLWLADLALRAKWRRVLNVPLAAVLLVVWAGLSLVPAFKGEEAKFITVLPAEGVKEAAQLIEYLVAAYLVFAYALRERPKAKLLMAALGVTTTVVLIAALIQYFSPSAEVPAMAVRGTFGNRNVLGGFLAVAIPLLAGYALFRGGWGYLTWAGLLTIAALVVVTSGGALAAMALGLLVVACLRNRWLPATVGTAGLAAMLLALPHLPRENHLLLAESVAPYRTSDRAKALGTRQDQALDKAHSAREALRKMKFTLLVEKDPDRDNLLALSRRTPDEADYFWPWQQRYQEWQAALNMVLASPAFGVGAGSYQANVNALRQYSDGFPLPTKMAGVNLMEEDALSMYTVLAACLGLPGLFALVWLLARHVALAVRRFGAEDPVRRGIAAGSLGGLAALMTAACFTDYLVRGLGLTLALLLALAASHAEVTRNNSEAS